MKCFNHRQADALATCKHCCRALCQDCLTDVRGAVSCRGTCEGPVAALVAATQALPQIRQQTGTAILVSAGMLVLLSLVCAAVAWSIGLTHIQDETLKGLQVIMYGMAGIVFLGAILSFLFARRLGQKLRAAATEAPFPASTTGGGR